MAVVIALPIADRLASYEFYRTALGFEAVGPLADDGVPEPLSFVVADGVQLMLIPTGGFAGVIGDHRVAERGQTECLVDIAVTNDAEVDELVERVRRAGARIVEGPGSKPWGYAALFEDPDGHLWSVTASHP